MRCPECDKRALSVASRCPSCGVEFPARTARRTRSTSDFGRLWPLVAVVTVVTATVGLGAMVLRRTSDRTVAAAPAPPPELDTAMAAASLPTAEGQPRFARTWTNVRDRRSPAADVVAVLLPGDTVLADSLAGGWWRVTFEGTPIGYVSHATLVLDPPPGTP